MAKHKDINRSFLYKIAFITLASIAILATLTFNIIAAHAQNDADKQSAASEEQVLDASQQEINNPTVEKGVNSINQKETTKSNKEKNEIKATIASYYKDLTVSYKDTITGQTGTFRDDDLELTFDTATDIDASFDDFTHEFRLCGILNQNDSNEIVDHDIVCTAYYPDAWINDADTAEKGTYTLYGAKSLK